MVTDSRQTEERLLAVCTMMRSAVDDTVREGIMRAVPDPVEARQLAEVHARLLHRIRAMELAMREFQADLARVDRIFGNAEKRVGGPELLTREVEAALRR